MVAIIYPMSMHEYLHENLGIEPLPQVDEIIDFGNHETLDDEYMGAPEPLTDIDLHILGQ